MRSGVDMSERRVLVTGASSGIGEATAKAFASAGAHVILIADHATNLASVLDSILTSGGRAIAGVVDLTKPEQIEDLLERMEQQTGPIDTLVNNAGVGLGASVLDTRLEDMRFVMEVNFFALVQLCQQAMRLMVPRRQGRIINVTSASGRFGSPTISIYSASKGAVHAFTQGLRIEARVHGLHVSEVTPISVRTPFFDHTKGEKYAPGGVVLTPEHVAASIVRCANAKNPPAEVLPYLPVRAAFLLDTLLPGLLDGLAGREYARSIHKK